MQTVLAVDLGGTKILVGEATRDGRILSSKSYPSDTASQRKAADKIKLAIADYLSSCSLEGELTGIGVCVVGRVSTEQGIWFEIHPGLAEPLYLADELEETFQFPCWLINDVSAAATAEKLLGVGKETENFIYINIGTGIAARVVSGGNTLIGGHFNAGEVGHMVVDIHSEECCACGRFGCVELFSSGLGMSNQVMKYKKDYPETVLEPAEDGRISFEALIKAYEAEDALALRVVTQALQGAAALVMNLVRVSDPEAVVFGGGVMTDNWFLKHLVTFLNGKTMRFVKKGCSVTLLNPGEIALMGAALLVYSNEEGGEGND